LEIPDLNESLTQAERTSLLNFLIAPDGQRLFQTNCSPCHGRAIAFTGEESELRETIRQGGMHLDMPPWRETLSPSELDTLAFYVVDPASVSQGPELFKKYCAGCHGDRIPKAAEFYAARDIIASGGGHETMPVWGDVLTDEQLDALVSYTLNAAKGTSLEIGQDLFATNCAPCHGDFGEGGANPTRPGDVIAPISTSEYLKTRDDFTLRAIISQGQPNFGMSPFGSSYGGPLDDTQIDAITTYLRSWEDNPPVELPPQIIPTVVAVSGEEIYQDLCSQCHGKNGEGGLGPSLRNPQFQASNTDQEIYTSIDLGHESTAMIGWGSILTEEQIQQLVDFIRQFPPGPAGSGPTPTAKPVSFASDILPLFKSKCGICHGNLGGWDASSYEAVMTSGDNAPVVIPGDPENSLLAHKLLGTQLEGTIMPPGGMLPQAEIQMILNWIAAGALDE
jgi:mono/diheme cytochrome c family protein